VFVSGRFGQLGSLSSNDESDQETDKRTARDENVIQNDDSDDKMSVVRASNTCLTNKPACTAAASH